MPLIDLKDLGKYMNKVISDTLQDEVAEQARKTLKEQVVEEVYDRYTPSHTGYQRTGGLYQDKNILTELEDDNTLIVKSIRKDEETGRDIAKVIETGVGYQWEDSRIYQMEPYPRPFHAETAKELNEKGLAKDAMKRGLKKRGFNVD